jgi:tetratricopeptide (TPR) repeat protein
MRCMTRSTTGRWSCLVAVCVLTSYGVAQTAPASPTAVHPDPSDQRIRFYQAQLARDPDFWVSYNRLAGAYAQKARETGDITYFELAESALEHSLKLESTHDEAAPAYVQMASVHLAEHRFQEAADDAAKAMSLIPGDLSALPYAGDAQMEMGNYPQSRKFYDLLANAPDDGKPHPAMAFLAASHTAGLDWIEGKTDRAGEGLQNAVKMARTLHLPAENLAWTEFMLGEQYFQLGKLDAAEREEMASLVAYPRYHRALAAMGRIRAAQGRLKESITFYTQAVAIIPLPIYVAALGDVYAASGNPVEAERQYKLVEYIGKLSAINRQVFNRELALFYADHDRKLPEALGLAQKELEVRHDVYSSDALAWALLKNGQTTRAQEAIEAALRMGTVDALLEYHAGMIYQAAGDHARAVAHLERALAINPHFHVLFAPQASKALAALHVAPSVSSASNATASGSLGLGGAASVAPAGGSHAQ